MIAQALERDPHLHLVAPVGHVATRLVDVVGVQVDRRVEPAASARPPGGAGRDAVAPDAILLHAERIHGEHRGAAVVEVGVEQDGDVVVRVDVVAVGQRRAHDAAVALERADPEVDRVGGVPDEHCGRVFGGTAVHRPVLREARQRRRPTPHGLVEHAVDLRLRLETRDAHVELFGEAAVGWTGVGGALKREEEGEHGEKICVVRGRWYRPKTAQRAVRTAAYEPSAPTHHVPRPHPVAPTIRRRTGYS